MNHTHLERYSESLLHDTVKRAGGLTIKLAPTHAGIPDRLVLLPPGQLYLVELKSETGQLSPIQISWHDQAARTGVHVHTLHGPDAVRRWVRERLDEAHDTDDASQERQRLFERIRLRAGKLDDPTLSHLVSEL